MRREYDTQKQHEYRSRFYPLHRPGHGRIVPRKDFDVHATVGHELYCHVAVVEQLRQNGHGAHAATTAAGRH